MRKTIIAGNWKMNKTTKETKEFFENFVPLVKDVKNVVSIIGVPFTSLCTAVEATKGSNVKIAAQNMNPNKEGAYTGEISPLMLKELGVEYVILGHSERREYYGETNAFINQKVIAALENGLTPILCVGETLEERESGKWKDVVKSQTVEGLDNISKEDMTKIVIAYEPVWAIGTGKTASPEQAQEVHAFIREVLTDKYSKEIAEEVTIQYGGSMNAGNAKELVSQKDIDGGLVGGASLAADTFSVVVKAGE